MLILYIIIYNNLLFKKVDYHGINQENMNN